MKAIYLITLHCRALLCILPCLLFVIPLRANNAGENQFIQKDLAPAANLNEPELYWLTTESSPLHGGVVSGGGEYAPGQEVYLQALPAGGHYLGYWTGDTQYLSSVTDPNPTLVMPAHDVNLTANFILYTHSVSTEIDPENSGHVSGTGVYGHGSTASLQANAENGFVFAHWSENGEILMENGSPPGPVYSFTVSHDRHLTAHFSPLIFTLNLEALPVNSGSVNGSGEYEYGQQVCIQAIPNSGFSFTEWSGNTEFINDNESPHTCFDMPAQDMLLTANFAEIPVFYTVNFQVNMQYVSQEFTGNDFDPETDQVFVSGNMVTEWPVPGSDPSTQELIKSEEDDMLYSLILSLKPGNYVYKYFLNEGWDGEEWMGEPFREFSLTGDLALYDWFASPTDPSHVICNDISILYQVYPNPSAGTFFVRAGNQIHSWQLYNQTGQLLKQHNPMSAFFTIPAHDIPKGIYLLRLESKSGLYTERVVVS